MEQATGDWIEPPLCACGDGYQGHSDHADTPPVMPKAGYTFLDSRPCKGCGARIYWWETVAGKPSPHDRDGLSHFASCPLREQFRRKGATR